MRFTGVSSGGISYPEGTDFVIRIAFLRINLSEKKRSKEERVETEEKPDNEAQRQLDRDLAEKERTKQEESSKGKEKAAKTPPLEKLKALLEKLPDLPDAAYDRIQEWEKKADRALKNADFYLNLISDPSSQEAVEKALSSIAWRSRSDGRAACDSRPAVSCHLWTCGDFAGF